MTIAELADYRRPADWPAEEFLVDADVQISPPSLTTLFPYLDDRWRDYIVEGGMGGLASNLYPASAPGVFLPGSTPAAGPPGSDLDLMKSQLLDPWRTSIAVLNCVYAVDQLHNDDLADALCRAVNQWQLEEWLLADSRLRGSAMLPLQNPTLAAREVKRIARHEEFVQIMLPARTREPLGRRGFWPIYAAAQEAGLPVAIQAAGISGNPLTPVGWPTYYVEDYVDLAQAFQAQVLSLVSEGVFAEFPDLRVVLVEGGFTWLPSLMWRFDKDWKGLRREVPWVKRPPSEVIRQHFRLTVQPLDEPDEPRHLLDVVDQLGADDLLLFATDYPHLQFGSGDRSIPRGLTPELRSKILSGNARRLYRF
jgi:predicted TIM-barrel fold metal-dependent hydrolase